MINGVLFMVSSEMAVKGAVGRVFSPFLFFLFLLCLSRSQEGKREAPLATIEGEIRQKSDSAKIKM